MTGDRTVPSSAQRAQSHAADGAGGELPIAPAGPRGVLVRLRLWIARAGVWLIKPALAATIDRHRLWYHLIVGDPALVEVHPTATLGNAILNVRSGRITVGAHAFFGQNVLILAGTHDPALRGAERFERLPDGGRDIVIEDGAWVASGAIVIGPCVVGRDAVVAAGSVVTRDVPPATVVAGIPAVPLRRV